MTSQQITKEEKELFNSLVREMSGLEDDNSSDWENWFEQVKTSEPLDNFLAWGFKEKLEKCENTLYRFENVQVGGKGKPRVSGYYMKSGDFTLVVHG